MVFHRSIVNWSEEGVDVFLVYVHSAICETYLVQQYSIDLLLQSAILNGYLL